MPVDIRVDGKVLDERLRELLSVLDARVLLRRVGARQEAWVDENFRVEGLERKWKRLRPGTVYQRRGGSRAVLQDSGRLKGSFSLRVGASTAIMGTNSRIAGVHDQGTDPFNIFPKNAKALTIPGRAGPVKFTKGKAKGLRGWFRKGFRHPGLPARPLLPTKALAERLAEKTIEAALRKASAN